jgi:hypothetical protein
MLYRFNVAQAPDVVRDENDQVEQESLDDETAPIVIR